MRIYIRWKSQNCERKKKKPQEKTERQTKHTKTTTERGYKRQTARQTDNSIKRRAICTRDKVDDGLESGEAHLWGQLLREHGHAEARGHRFVVRLEQQRVYIRWLELQSCVVIGVWTIKNVYQLLSGAMPPPEHFRGGGASLLASVSLIYISRHVKLVF